MFKSFGSTLEILLGADVPVPKHCRTTDTKKASRNLAPHSQLSLFRARVCIMHPRWIGWAHSSEFTEPLGSTVEYGNKILREPAEHLHAMVEEYVTSQPAFALTASLLPRLSFGYQLFPKNIYKSDFLTSWKQVKQDLEVKKSKKSCVPSAGTPMLCLNHSCEETEPDEFSGSIFKNE
jgi:hypothetical protein